MRVLTLHKLQFEMACRQLAHAVAEDSYPQVIVGIVNGGAVVGREIHRYFPDAKYCEVSLHRKGSQHKSLVAPLLRLLPTSIADRLRIAESVRLAKRPVGVPEHYDLPKDTVELLSDAKCVLVVDDAVDSGLTMRRIVDAIEDITFDDCRIITAAITVTTDQTLVDVRHAIYRDKTLIRFPWSNDYRQSRPSPDPSLPDSMSGQAVIVDMDGTLLAHNSWPVFAKAVWKHEISSGHIRTVYRLLKMHIGRKSGKLPHKIEKYHFARLSRTYSPEFFTCLTIRLAAMTNKQVKRLLDNAEKHGASIIIATAAAAEYTLPLLHKMGYGLIVCSSTADCDMDEYTETKGETKVRAVKQLLDDLKLKPAIVLTDHYHDLPMLQAFPEAQRIIVKPSKTTLATCGKYAELVLY